LEAESPGGVGEAILEGEAGVLGGVWAIHGLEEEVLEVEAGEVFGERERLGVDEFEFVASGEVEGRAGFWADADPIEVGWRGLCAVGLDGDFEVELMERVDGGVVELEEGLAAGADDEGLGAGL